MSIQKRSNASPSHHCDCPDAELAWQEDMIADHKQWEVSKDIQLLTPGAAAWRRLRGLPDSSVLRPAPGPQQTSASVFKMLRALQALQNRLREVELQGSANPVTSEGQKSDTGPPEVRSKRPCPAALLTIACYRQSYRDSILSLPARPMSCAAVPITTGLCLRNCIELLIQLDLTVGELSCEKFQHINGVTTHWDGAGGHLRQRVQPTSETPISCAAVAVPRTTARFELDAPPLDLTT